MLVGTGAGAGAGARFEELFSFRGVLEKQSCSLVFEGSLVDTGVEGTGLCGFRAIVGKVLMSLFWVNLLAGAGVDVDVDATGFLEIWWWLLVSFFWDGVVMGTAAGITPFLFGFLARPMFNQV
jgi:hypothetical protein